MNITEQQEHGPAKNDPCFDDFCYEENVYDESDSALSFAFNSGEYSHLGKLIVGRYLDDSVRGW